MSNEIQVFFGSFQFTGNYSVSNVDIPEPMPVRISNIPKNDGSVAEEAKRKSVEIKLKGTVKGSDYDDLRSNMDDLRAAIYAGKQFLTFDDDRKIKCQLKSFSTKSIFFRRYIAFNISFIADYPYFVSQSETPDDRVPTSGVTYNLTNNGNAPARCKIEITAPGGGISDDIQIDNTTNGQQCKYRGDVAAGEDLEIDNRYDTDDFEVLNNGVDDFTNFEGDFMVLEPGVNAVKFTGPASTGVKFTWRDTYV